MNTAQQLMIMALLTVVPAVGLSKSGEPERVESLYGKDHMVTVEEIDHANNAIVVSDGPGNSNSRAMQIYPGVTSFDDVAQGDRGEIKYLEAVLVALDEEPGPAAPEQTSNTYIVRNSSVKPEGVEVPTYTVTATVSRVEYEQSNRGQPSGEVRSVRLQGPNGNLYDVSIAEDLPEARKLSRGDQVTAEITPMLAVDFVSQE